MRPIASCGPFGTTMTNDKGKDIIPASRLEFIGGYAGLWKTSIPNQKSIRNTLMGQQGGELAISRRQAQSEPGFPQDEIPHHARQRETVAQQNPLGPVLKNSNDQD